MAVSAPTTVPLPAGLTPDRIGRGFDPWILGAVVLLLSIGTVMVYSASAVRAFDQNGVSSAYLARHVVSIGVGLFGMAVAMRVPVERLSKAAYPLLGLTVLMLILVFVPGLGRRVNGALRWITLGPVRFQPGELAKLAVVVYLAHALAKKRDGVRDFKTGFLPLVGLTSLIVALIISQPDFGTSMIVLSVLGLMLFVAGTKIGYLVLGGVMAVPVGYHYVSSRPHAWARLIAFLDPEAHRANIGYQIWESLVSFGSGGVFGAGLGAGQQKLYFLPEAHTDFVYAVVGEELGFVGALTVLSLFCLLAGRGLWVAGRASARFPMLLAFGISCWLGIQALTNMAVVIALVPTKGLTLPFVSFGGSSMVAALIGVGVLLRVSAEESNVVRQDRAGRAAG